MVLCMRGNGLTAMQVVKENFIMLMETSMKDNGQIIKPTGLGFIQTQKEQGMKVSGKMINSMGRGLKSGMKDLNMRATMH